MPTERQRRNLWRGPGSPEAARRAREGKAAHREDEEALAAAVEAEPEAALVALHADLAVATRRLLRKWLRSGGEPTRAVIESVKEMRLLSDRLIELRHSAGAAQEQREFFDQLADRIATLNGFAIPAEPVVEPPA